MVDFVLDVSFVEPVGESTVVDFWDGMETGFDLGVEATGGASTWASVAGGEGESVVEDFATGGVATGGLAAGALATGGAAMGGIETGGLVTGGLATGGLVAGGLVAGGVAIGGGAAGGNNFSPAHFGQDSEPSAETVSFVWHFLQSLVTV